MQPKTFDLGHNPRHAWEAVRWIESNATAAAARTLSLGAATLRELRACRDEREVEKFGCVRGVSCATGPQRCAYCTQRDE